MQALFSISNPTAFNALINLGQVGTGCVSLWCCKQRYDVLWWLLFQCYGRLSAQTFQFVLTWIEHLRSCNPISTVWITADGRWMVIWIYQSYDEGKMLQPVESLKDWFESLKDRLFYLFIFKSCFWLLDLLALKILIHLLALEQTLCLRWTTHELSCFNYKRGAVPPVFHNIQSDPHIWFGKDLSGNWH